jgi:hypothetical protein
MGARTPRPRLGTYHEAARAYAVTGTHEHIAKRSE